MRWTKPANGLRAETTYPLLSLSSWSSAETFNKGKPNRTEKRLIKVATMLGVLFLIACGTSVVAFLQKGKAEEQKGIAEEQTTIAIQNQEVADSLRRIAETDQKRLEILSMEIQREADSLRNNLSEAEKNIDRETNNDILKTQITELQLRTKLYSFQIDSLFQENQLLNEELIQKNKQLENLQYELDQLLRRNKEPVQQIQSQQRKSK